MAGAGSRRATSVWKRTDGGERTSRATRVTETNQTAGLVPASWRSRCPTCLDDALRRPDLYRHLRNDALSYLLERRLFLKRVVPPRGHDPLPANFASLCPFLGTVAKAKRSIELSSVVAVEGIGPLRSFAPNEWTRCVSRAPDRRLTRDHCGEIEAGTVGIEPTAFRLTNGR